MDTQWIDYRAWHHDKKVMIHVSEIDFRKRRIKGRAKDEVISASFVIDNEMGILLARCIADDLYPFVMFDLAMLLDDDEQIKVIGNAYENPELLEMKEV